MGIEPEFCEVCGEIMSADGYDGICGDCQEELDNVGADVDDEDDSEEEYSRGPYW